MKYNGLNVLVTGADGFIGSHLTEKLVRCGAKVTALCFYNSFDHCGWLDDLPEAVHAKLRVVRGDIRDSAFVRRITQGQNIVFHLAALIAIPHSYTAAQSYVESNVLGTLNLLEAARESGVTRFVQTSTSEVYGTALTMPITESQAFLAIGAAANIRFGCAYNAGSGHAVTIMDIVDLVVRLTNCRKARVERDAARMRPVGSEVRALLADSSRLNADTGWQTTIDLCEGVKRTIAWWRNRLASGLVRRESAFIT